MSTIKAFEGFPIEGRQFLIDLEANNNREWFNANKKTFQKTLQEPALAFIVALGTRLQDISEDIVADTRTNGAGSLMRINRDTRFSKDKSPYKRNVAMMWWEGAGKKTENPAFGMQMNAEGSGLMAGLFGFDKSMLDAYRQGVDDPSLGEDLESIVNTLDSSGYEVNGEQYKKVPNGFDADHPHGDLLKYKGLWTSKSDLTWDVMTSAEFVDVCFNHCCLMAPLQQWLVKAANRITA